MSVQAVLFSIDEGWTIDNANKWLHKHRYKPIKKVHKTKKYLRYRISSPKHYDKMRVKPLSEGIKLILGW